MINKNRYNFQLLVTYKCVLGLNCHDQTEDKLIEFVRNNILIPPPKEKEFNKSFLVPREFKYSIEGSNSLHRQDILLDDLIFKGNLKNGFFVEAGAFDFIIQSNSLHFELRHNWSGLLVEAIPNLLQYG